MKTEIAVDKIIYKLIEKMDLKKEPNEAGKQIREYYDELVKQFKEQGYNEITKVIVDNYLDMTIAVLEKEEVDWITGNTALNVVNIYMGIAETDKEEPEAEATEDENSEKEILG
jgi:hypothetical protein